MTVMVRIVTLQGIFLSCGQHGEVLGGNERGWGRGWLFAVRGSLFAVFTRPKHEDGRGSLKIGGSSMRYRKYRSWAASIIANPMIHFTYLDTPQHSLNMFPYISMYSHVSPCISRYLHVSPCISMHLQVSPGISRYLHLLPNLPLQNPVFFVPSPRSGCRKAQ